MKLSEIMYTAKDFLDYELKDGPGDFGGIPHEHYTLDEYLKEISNNNTQYEAYLLCDMHEINNLLVTESGIAPIPYNLERERMQHACMLAYYAAKNGADDSIAIFDKCVQISQSIDFEMIQYEGRWVIDTEWERERAKEYAKLAESLAEKNEHSSCNGCLGCEHSFLAFREGLQPCSDAFKPHAIHCGLYNHNMDKEA